MRQNLGTEKDTAYGGEGRRPVDLVSILPPATLEPAGREPDMGAGTIGLEIEGVVEELRHCTRSVTDGTPVASEIGNPIVLPMTRLLNERGVAAVPTGRPATHADSPLLRGRLAIRSIPFNPTARPASAGAAGLGGFACRRTLAVTSLCFATGRTGSPVPRTASPPLRTTRQWSPSVRDSEEGSRPTSSGLPSPRRHPASPFSQGQATGPMWTHDASWRGGSAGAASRSSYPR